MTFNKSEIFEAFKKVLIDKIEVSTEEALAQRDAATNEESKAENKYDTRGLEASYIAQAHAERIQEMKEGLYKLIKTQIKNFEETIQVGDLIEVFETNTEQTHYFILLPVGGLEVTIDKVKIRSLSPISPLGRKLLNLHEGDDFELNKKAYDVVKAF